MRGRPVTPQDDQTLGRFGLSGVARHPTLLEGTLMTKRRPKALRVRTGRGGPCEVRPAGVQRRKGPMRRWTVENWDRGAHFATKDFCRGCQENYGDQTPASASERP